MSIKFVITKDNRNKRGAQIDIVDCEGATASYSDNTGHRIIDFDAEGRRWTVALNDALIRQLYHQIENHPAPPS